MLHVLDWMLKRFKFVTLTQASLSTGKCASRERRHTGKRFGCEPANSIHMNEILPNSLGFDCFVGDGTEPVHVTC